MLSREWIKRMGLLFISVLAVSGALGSNPTMKGELDAALRRVSTKSGAAAAPAAAPAAQPAATATEGEGIEVTRKKRDELEESFRQELWDEDETQ